MLNFSKIPHLLNKQETKLFLLAFFVLTFCFFPLITNFIWGNHDWLALKQDGHLTAGFVEGRISQYLFLGLFLDYHILPVLNTILGFAFYSLTIVLLFSRFFEFDYNTPSAFLTVATVASLPYINEITYFQFIILSQLLWTFTIFLSLFTAKKAFYSNPVIYTTLSTLLLFLSIGGYPASANLFVIATVLYLLKNYSGTQNLSETLKKSIPFAISILISFISLYFVYQYLQNHNLMIKLYNTDSLSLKELITKLPSSFLLSLKSLISPQPFFDLSYKLLSSFIIFSFAFCFIKKSTSKTNFLVRILFIIAIFIGIKFSAILVKEAPSNYFSKNDPPFFMIRTDFYAIPTLILFALCFLRLTTPQYFKNTLTLITSILIITNINNNLNYSKVQTLGFLSEQKLLDRITSRIKDSKNFTPNSYYALAQITELSLRPRFYHKLYSNKQGLYTLNQPFTRYWLPHDHYNFYSPTTFVSKANNINPKDITPEMIDFFTTKIALWPKINSLYIDNKYIILALSPDGMLSLKKQFNQIKEMKK